MIHFLGITKYHIGVLVAYTLVLILAASSYPTILRFEPSLYALGIVVSIFVATAIGFVFLRGFFEREVTFQRISLSNVILLFLYAAAFAIPEGIIFRSVVQTFVERGLSSTNFAIAASTIVFAFAHLPNGASGWHPSKWNWEFFWLALFAGIPLGVSYALTHTLFAPTILHVLFLAGARVCTQRM